MTSCVQRKGLMEILASEAIAAELFIKLRFHVTKQHKCTPAKPPDGSPIGPTEICRTYNNRK